jgi:hypothetical protein
MLQSGTTNTRISCGGYLHLACAYLNIDRSEGPFAYLDEVEGRNRLYRWQGTSGFESHDFYAVLFSCRKFESGCDL